jgi:4-amino-4-deoxy-L-arabinose transferase-like glycosyltransferase
MEYGAAPARSEQRELKATGRAENSVLPFETPLILVILFFTIAILWASPLGSSLWLDETGTVWAIRGSLTDTIIRSWDRPGQPSVLFSVLTWLTVAVGGLHETTLRLQSMLGCLIAGIGVYRLTLRFAGWRQALLASGVFALNANIVFAAADARPYGLALMAAVWAMLMLIYWCETNRLAYGVAYAFLAALSVWLHYGCFVMLLIYAAYLAGQTRFRLPRHFWVVGALLLIAMIPLFHHASHLWRYRAAHSFARTPTTDNLIDAVLPARLLALVVLGLLLTRFFSPGWVSKSFFTPTQVFLVVWYIVPPALLWLVSRVSDAKLFVPRYYLWSVPGLAILVASLVGKINSPRARSIITVCIMAGLCHRPISSGPAAHGGEDWRGALSYAKRTLDADAVFLLQSGFVESRIDKGVQPTTIDDPIVSPLAMYPAGHDVVSIPSELDNRDFQRLESIVSNAQMRRATLVAVSREPSPLPVWLRGRFSGTPYDVNGTRQFNGVTALVFRRRGN